MQWINITLENLQQTKAAALIEALRTAALAQGQIDPMPGIIESVAARIRAEIKGCKHNQLDANEGTIPFSLKSLSCRMILREMQSRLQILLNSDEQEEQRNDLIYLARIARCEVPVDSPDNPAGGGLQAGSGNPSIASRPSRFKASQQEGV